MCLSKTYVSTYTKFRWRCAEGHEWKAKPIGVKAGNWCPACVGRPQLTIEDMQVRAKERGGVCLSTVYVNARTKLRWRCTEGHEWQAVPHSIKSGRWCQACFNARRGRRAPA